MTGTSLTMSCPSKMEMKQKKLPEDYALDALAREARRREALLGRPYSYGRLVSDTTPEERERICCAYMEAKVGKGD